MADSDDHRGFLYHLHHQPAPVSAVQWLPSTSPFHRHAVLASPSALQIHSLSSPNNLHLTSSHPLSSPITSLSCPPNPSSVTLTLAAGTSTGSLHFLFVNPYDGSFNSDSVSVSDKSAFHSGPIQSIDTQTGSTGESITVTAGEDGRVNIVTLGGERVENIRVCESEGLAAYTAVKWGSEVEFVTGGVGPGLQWWDTRRPGGAVAQFKGIWGGGMIHSMDIHPSRKHTCVVGGSAGTVFAWDLRYQNQAVELAGGSKSRVLSRSEIWEVKYDHFAPLISSRNVLPVMVCSEDGFLAVLNQDEDPVQLLEEPCAINSFDIDPQNPSDVIFALEWESIGILSRGKEAIAMD
ncbi:hypothetical protein LUZ60_008833 [Juncus effusus]|nr:hypothetical protein LUZ60_008833 [Juncus effusus]